MSKSFSAAYSAVSNALFSTITNDYFSQPENDEQNYDPELPFSKSTVKNSYSTVAVAVSGGADSLALAAVAQKAAHKFELKTLAIIIDHQMQDGSDKVAEKAANQCTTLGFDNVIVEKVLVNKKDGGPEAAARKQRYAALEKIATENGAFVVLLGHTLNDQAETVLLALSRGSGMSALSGMRENNGIFARPFLSITRSDTEEICKEKGLDFWSDPTNGSLNADNSSLPLRSQVRNTLLPVMRDVLGKDIEKQLAKTAELIAQDDDCLQLIAELDFEDLLISKPEKNMIRLSAENLSEYPKGITARVLKIALENVGMDMSRLLNAHILQIYDLIYDFSGQKPLNLPKLKVSRIGSILVFEK
ncbi:MAG: tRNA lysidine(34) synthetase TilS [Bifidobacteriaceae bacterium]|jgi:tRNA(Ile)-lysidine synthase|nr:tRNA lysidine(34) synthetase TilS [Bifidobacteriaceae bacterium]